MPPPPPPRKPAAPPRVNGNMRPRSLAGALWRAQREGDLRKLEDHESLAEQRGTKRKAEDSQGRSAPVMHSKRALNFSGLEGIDAEAEEAAAHEAGPAAAAAVGEAGPAGPAGPAVAGEAEAITRIELDFGDRPEHGVQGGISLLNNVQDILAKRKQVQVQDEGRNRCWPERSLKRKRANSPPML